MRKNVKNVIIEVYRGVFSMFNREENIKDEIILMTLTVLT